MELKEFIAQTIIQIADGLRDGHDYINKNGFGSGVIDTYSREVSFDIAVASNEEESSGVKGRISVANILLQAPLETYASYDFGIILITNVFINLGKPQFMQLTDLQFIHKNVFTRICRTS
jgi:hypothetical protein